ncbi:unnamed protein product [Fusarium graminearum]|nr:unnamed protein product [Fusarium graminearum]CAG1960970.1 unnamed protein product [Fusarium graminearum]VTO83912.1 unnamed protein product [Fusarium graminearum]
MTFQLRTFVAIYKSILDNHALSVQSRKLFRLAPHFPQILAPILASRSTIRCWYTEDMAGEEVLRGDDLSRSSPALGLAEREENIRRWNQ